VLRTKPIGVTKSRSVRPIFVFTGRIARSTALPVLCLLRGLIFWFSPVICPLIPAKFHLDRFRDVDVRPHSLQNYEFYQYNYRKWRVPRAILTKFTAFMRVLRLHYYSTKFGCFTSTSNKAIKIKLVGGIFTKF